ncbi:unnamed protein product [Arabidopsis lyrata]|uniref:uncharacterized protein LOC9307008 n=1 Tax=Arabidopsis lyrata subsp. lyrata TaxID=81972 RepID=UPI000A29CF0E|nr:uncharacterized protein LOC9307008 [Arabidopsis lyrata subsp. lyrata]CAH8269730.1 unnamed protein product [Arabidopsis lyrata]|eukprot:XP_020878565.1 uncharacterized protein LOC9307008 [Arabidopsis lyrata subsp. lyrata]
MSRRTSKRVSFSPDPEANDELVFPTHTGLSSSSRHGRRRVVVGIFSFSVSDPPAARRLLRRIGARVSKTFRYISLGRKSNNTKTTPSSSRNLSSSSSLSCSSSYSSSSIYLMKSKSLNESESHRAEAIEDCIEFLNSCSSLSRSNSISTWSC